MKSLLSLLALGLLLSACGGSHATNSPAADSTTVEEPVVVLTPLPDTAMASVGDIVWDYIDYTIKDTAYAWPAPELNSLESSYAHVSGHLTFRNSPERTADFGGTVKGQPSRIVKTWTFQTATSGPVTSLGTWGGGSGWTGQPLYIHWPDSVFGRMKQAPQLTADFGQEEIIVGSLCGRVYFINYQTGKASRQPLDVGNVTKGTPSLDPSLNGSLYVGQAVPSTSPFGCTAFNLYTMERFFMKDRDPQARRGWGAYDSSPVVAGGFLFWPGENGTLYKYTRDASRPNTLRLYGALRYSVRGAAPGMESSLAVYRNYGYVSDNHGHILCVNLSTMKPVWVFHNQDDSDSTPVVIEEDGVPYVYSGSEVDRRGDNQPARFVKLNGLTGEQVWLNEVLCKRWHCNESKIIDGGIFATPLPGGGDCDSLIYVSVCRHSYDKSPGDLIAYNRYTGKEHHRTTLKWYAWSSPVAFYNENDEMFIFLGDCTGNVYLIRGRDGQILYTEHMGNNFESSPVVIGNTAVVGSRGSEIYKFTIE